jgi:hypothetical protein
MSAVSCVEAGAVVGGSTDSNNCPVVRQIIATSAAIQLFSFTFHKELDSSTGSAQVRIIFLLRMQIVSSKVRPQCMREMSLSAAYRLPLSRRMPAVLEGESLEDA